MENFKTPILLIVFNRIETTKKVFQVIREVKPLNLYIASDGPRLDRIKEKNLVEDVRFFLKKNIDWKCNLHLLFQENNLGCKIAVKTAIDWLFENETEGIILEDDILCDNTFFFFCKELLEKYRFDQRIGMISGNNHIGYSPSNGDSYVFSKFKFTWGWATWKRAWLKMDLNLEMLKGANSEDISKNMGYTERSIIHWKGIETQLMKGIVNTWDYQWFFSLSAQSQFCIFPKVNLCANIGFGEDATHCIARNVPAAYVIKHQIDFPLNHPKHVVVNFVFENIYEKERIYIQPYWKRIIPLWLKKFYKKIKFLPYKYYL